MPGFPYRLEDGAENKLGLIVLQVDEPIEGDFRRIIPPDAAQLHVSRVPSGDALTPETVSVMETKLAASAALLPPASRFDVVGYACTSGTALIGAERVRTLVKQGVATRQVTDPLSAAVAATEALGVKKLGIVSPYIATVANSLSDAFRDAGITVAETLSFGEDVEARVARISPASISEAAVALARRGGLDGIFISCTNLRTLSVIEPLEKEIGLPVLSSNQVLAWHMARISPAPITLSGPGLLFEI